MAVPDAGCAASPQGPKSQRGRLRESTLQGNEEKSLGVVRGRSMLARGRDFRFAEVCNERRRERGERDRPPETAVLKRAGPTQNGTSDPPSAGDGSDFGRQGRACSARPSTGPAFTGPKGSACSARWASAQERPQQNSRDLDRHNGHEAGHCARSPAARILPGFSLPQDKMSRCLFPALHCCAAMYLVGLPL